MTKRRDPNEEIARIIASGEEDSRLLFRAAHKPLLTKTKGKYRIACVCGWNGVGKHDSEEKALSLYPPHTGIHEKIGGR